MFRAAMWVAEIDDKEDDAKLDRFHPFMVSFMDDQKVSVPLLGAWAMYKGSKRSKPLQSALEAMAVSVH